MLAALTDQKVVRVLSVKHIGDSEPYCTVLTAVMDSGLERVMSVREKEIHTPINNSHYSSHRSPLQQPFPCHISSVRKMSDTSGYSRFQPLFEAALTEYETQTKMKLVSHPLYLKLNTCNSVQSITTTVLDQAQAFSDDSEETMGR